MKLVVVGAKPGSLGAAVAEVAREERFGWEVVTVGVSRAEQFSLDLVHSTDSEIEHWLAHVAPDHIVCTAGINHPRNAYGSTAHWLAEHFNANVIGPMRLLDAFLRLQPGDVPLRHYVAISSNSATIPRTDSEAYCASKAALSMGLRVAARNVASVAIQETVVYGYEPGLLAGTPMTVATAQRWPNTPLTRMRGAMVEHGLSAYGLAAHIVRNIAFGGPELNGVLLRLDAGEV